MNKLSGKSPEPMSFKTMTGNHHMFCWAFSQLTFFFAVISLLLAVFNDNWRYVFVTAFLAMSMVTTHLFSEMDDSETMTKVWMRISNFLKVVTIVAMIAGFGYMIRLTS
jgi:hypothetical protein